MATTLYTGTLYVFKRENADGTGLDVGSTTDATTASRATATVTLDGTTLTVKLEDSGLAKNVSISYGGTTIKPTGYIPTASFTYRQASNSVTFTILGNTNTYGDYSFFGDTYENSGTVTNKTKSISWTNPNTKPTGTISASNVRAGSTATINWSLSDVDGGFVMSTQLSEYYKAPGSSSYTTTHFSIGSSARSYSYTIPTSYEGGNIYYVVRFTDGYSDGSNSATSPTYTVGAANSAPSTPGTPILPLEIKGGSSIAVSWSAASDTDGNLSGYELYVSLDSGSWAQVYKGSSRSYNYTVPEGTETIAFRVRAYDSMSAYSSYATSATSAVTNVTIVDYGYVNIDGVNRNFTGEGYATIDGVSRPLVKYFSCVDSIWRSLSTGTKVVNLPAGYTQCEYIASNNAYIDTGYKPNNNTRLEVTYYTYGTSTSAVAACDTNWNNNGFGIWQTGTEFGNATQTFSAIRDTKLEASLENGTFTQNGTTYNLTASTFQTVNNMYLFALNRNGSAIEIATNLRIYTCKLYESNVLVRNFVPCMNPKGEIGMYDTAGGTFYGNIGTGVFTAGEPVVSTFYPLPGEFTRTEYIESTGTQWINTGVSGSSNVGFEIDFLTNSVVGPASTDFGTIFGVYTAGSTRINLGTWNSSQVTTGGEMCWGSNTYNPYITSGTRMQVSIIDTTLTTPNGTQTTSSGTFTSGATIGLFARNNNGTADQFSKTKLYSFKLYEGDELVRDFIPCINAAGVAGLWDKINGKFYGNSGSGTFISGQTLIEGYTDITPNMTSHTAPSGYVVSASSEQDTPCQSWMAFDGVSPTVSTAGYWHSTVNMPQWIMMQFPAAVRVDMFSVRNCGVLEGYSLYGITAFTLEGSNNGSSFTTLGTYTNAGEAGTMTQYQVESTGSYQYYRINISSARYTYNSNPYALIEQIRFYQKNT